MSLQAPPQPSQRAWLAALPALVVLTIVLCGVILACFPETPPPAQAARAVTPPVLARTAAPLTETALRLTGDEETSRPVVEPRPTPRWIWSTRDAGAAQTTWLRRRVEAGASVSRALLRFSADNHAEVTINGATAGRGDDWQRPEEIDVTAAARTGALDIVVEARNDGGPAAFVALLEIVDRDGSRRWVASDTSWETADEAEFRAPRAAVDLGPLGTGPWGALAGLTGGDMDRAIRVAEGFAVDLVYAVPRQQGSWVCLAADPAGRIIASDQSSGLYRLRPAAPGRPAAETVVEPIEPAPGGAQGLLVLGRDLYVVVNVGGPSGPGLYRMRDVDGDDRYDETELLRGMPGGTGEHGAHAIVQGPDDLLYVAGGNHTALPDPERSAVPRVWDEDYLLPRLWDARGHAVGVLAPGGWVCRTDLDGREWELVSSGYRNAYDIAFNPDGELFTYDADMEWDMGAPWYRPTRVCHVTSGSEFGWRSGTAKWPPHYPDSLPATVDIGPGSPTGIVFGTGSAFPPRYRDSLFILDWTFGTMYALHLRPDGATYRAEKEIFLTGRPLPLTDAVVSPADGALYFAVGGRGVASAVYRVRWTGGPVGPATGGSDPVAAAARARRHELEALHRDGAPAAALDAIWPALADGDRFIRFAARVALEHQPPQRWAGRAVSETQPRTALAALLALARTGGAAHADAVASALSRIAWEDLDRSERLELLRCWALRFIRQGPPDASLARTLLDRLDPVYPTGDADLDRELCDMLVYLGSTRVVARTIPLMERPDEGEVLEIDEALLSRSDAYGQIILQMASARPQQQQVYYALSLRNAEHGWSGPLRRRYFRWFETARQTQGGMSFAGFLDNIRAEALERVPEPERERYAQLGRYERPDPDPATRPRGPGRSWTTAEATALLDDGLAHRDFERGRQLYRGAMCAQCHRLAGTGLAGGPDLTGLATRFSPAEIVETIVEPSRTISDQYEQTEVTLRDGRTLIGRVVSEDEQTLRLLPSLLEPQATIDVDVADVAERHPSAVSSMMPFLLDGMAPGEVLDLVAYLVSGGDPRAPCYEPAGAGEWRALFDGRSLDGWSGDAARWSVRDGEIVGRSTAEAPLSRNIFLVLGEPLPDDFELRAEVLLVGANNSGIQYRSRAAADGTVTGSQCDVHPNPPYDGMLYEEGGRGIVAQQGRRIRLTADGRTTALREAAPAIAFDRGSWHQYAIIARGNRVEHRVDGTVTCVVEDEQQRPAGDRMALQLHGGAPYEVRFRDIRVRELQ